MNIPTSNDRLTSPVRTAAANRPCKTPCRCLSIAQLARSLGTIAVLLSVAATVDAIDPLQTDNPEPIVYQEPFDVRGVRPAGALSEVLTLEFAQELPASARSWGSLTDSLPNFKVGAGGAGSFGDTFSIRGLSNTPYFSDSAVTVYLDGIPLGSSFTYPTNLALISSATVMRGPQGTGIGRAGTGGVVLLQSPAPETAGGELRLGAGRFDSWTAFGRAHTAAAGRTDATVSAWSQQRDGYVFNTILGTPVDDRDERGAHARIRWRPNDRTELAFVAMGQRSRDGAQPLVPVVGPKFEVSRSFEGQTDIESAAMALKGSISMADGVVLSSVTSFTHWKLDPYVSHLILPPGIDSRLVQDQENWNQEVRLHSAPDAATQWVAGAWFTRGETNGSVNRGLTGLFPIEASRFELVSRAAAVFGEATLPVGSRARLTGGVRLESVRKTFSRSETIPTNSGFEAKRSFDGLHGKIGVEVDISDRTIASASVSSGTKPGGYSAYTNNSDLAPFDAERVDAIEAGIATANPDGRFRLTASAFAYFVRDYQIERSFTATDYIVVNAPRARSLGGEVGFEWTAADGLEVRGGVGITRMTLREFRDPFTGETHDGKRAPYSPSHTASLEVEYRTAAGWFGSVRVNAVGDTFFEESEDPLLSQGSYALLGARIGYATTRWGLTLFSENLTDTHYFALMVPGIGHGAPGAPRAIGAEMSFRF